MKKVLEKSLIVTLVLGTLFAVANVQSFADDHESNDEISTQSTMTDDQAEGDFEVQSESESSSEDDSEE